MRADTDPPSSMSYEPIGAQANRLLSLVKVFGTKLMPPASARAT